MTEYQEFIVNLVLRESGISSLRRLNQRSRKREHVFPRRAISYLLNKYTNAGTSEIGRILRRDHSTITHLIKTWDHLDPAERRRFDLIEKYVVEGSDDPSGIPLELWARATLIGEIRRLRDVLKEHASKSDSIRAPFRPGYGIEGAI